MTPELFQRKRVELVQILHFAMESEINEMKITSNVIPVLGVDIELRWVS